jgi:hypothetical protein
MEWIKFKDKVPPEPKTTREADIPVLIGINTEVDGFLADLIYWRRGAKKWRLGYESSYIYIDFGYLIEFLSWFAFPLPELEKENGVED